MFLSCGGGGGGGDVPPPPAPSGDIWQCLEIFWVITVRSSAIVMGEWRPGLLLTTHHGTAPENPPVQAVSGVETEKFAYNSEGHQFDLA